MDKKVKVSLLIFLILLLLFFVGILIYANFIANFNDNNTSNSLENKEPTSNDSLEDSDNPIKNSIAGTDITDFNIFYDDVKEKYIIGFKITNNTSDKLYSFYTLLSLRDNKKNLIDEVIIEVLSLEGNQSRYISYETDIDISNATSFSFEVIEVGGIGN